MENLTQSWLIVLCRCKNMIKNLKKTKIFFQRIIQLVHVKVIPDVIRKEWERELNINLSNLFFIAN